MKPGISFAAFSREKIVALLGNGRSGDGPVEYVAAYLGELGASSLFFEHHYVDRHFLDDFTQYYSKSFRPPEPVCSRFHFFKSVSRERLEELTQSAFKGPEELKVAEAELSAHYLGFVVKRPLSGAPIGRTVLKTYPAESRRQYAVVRPYVVNPAGLRLTIEGLAYQQQDRGAAVCASTALWVALQRVSYVAGHRSPTPSSVTSAADSPFPASHGLDPSQMARALRSLGYIADVFSPAENRALFRAKVSACLESNLPVILLLTKKQDTGAGQILQGHAVTLTGFSEPEAVVPVPTPYKGVKEFLLRSGSLKIVYVHDDNLGSHAHYELVDSEEINSDGHKILKVLRGRDNKPAASWWQVDLWDVVGALVPKPEELRLPVENLFLNLLWLRPLFEDIVFKEKTLHFAARFESGVAYQRRMFERRFDAERRRSFLSQTSLPRQIGVLTFLTGEKRLCEVLLDVSEIERNPAKPSILGLVAPGVPVGSTAWKRLKDVAKVFEDCPFLPASQ